MRCGSPGWSRSCTRSATDSGQHARYLAGDDALRAADLRAALTDPSIAGIIFATGGSGAQRTLAALDWDEPGRAWRRRCWPAYSDVTAILEAFAARLGWASLHGPMVSSSGDTAHYSFGSLLRALMRPDEAVLTQLPGSVAAGRRRRPRDDPGRQPDAAVLVGGHRHLAGPRAAASC